MKKFLAVLLGSLCLLTFTGCTKEEVLDTYNFAIETIGRQALTKDHALTGTRQFDDNDFTGTYHADYHGFSDAERIFGGTSLRIPANQKLVITCAMHPKKGTARLILQTSYQKPEILTENTDLFAKEIEIAPGSAYLLLDCDDYFGSIDLKITRKDT